MSGKEFMKLQMSSQVESKTSLNKQDRFKNSQKMLQTKIRNNLVINSTQVNMCTQALYSKTTKCSHQQQSIHPTINQKKRLFKN